MHKPSKEKPIIAWWSGGVTSAIACWIAINMYGVDNVRIIFIDTKNEDNDTYRFKVDCEKWYRKTIETITSNEFNSIKEVWYKFLSLNVASGAICSTHLKLAVRIQFQKTNNYSHQVFGFDIDETKRAKAMTLNYPDAKPLYILLLHGFSKNHCIELLNDNWIRIPDSYHLGLNNNNCLKTGCVQGGIGYWQYMKTIKPDVFKAMAEVEHELTNLSGQPVTMLKDQGKNGKLIFLLPHPDYPNYKDISMMKGRKPKPLMECNGFCGINDLSKNVTENEINFSSK